jgi:hypothetical protein
LKERTKELLFVSVRAERDWRVNQASKSLLVLFFRKELLPCFTPPPSTPAAIHHAPNLP